MCRASLDRIRAAARAMHNVGQQRGTVLQNEVASHLPSEKEKEKEEMSLRGWA